MFPASRGPGTGGSSPGGGRCRGGAGKPGGPQGSAPGRGSRGPAQGLRPDPPASTVRPGANLRQMTAARARPPQGRPPCPPGAWRCRGGRVSPVQAGHPERPRAGAVPIGTAPTRHLTRGLRSACLCRDPGRRTRPQPGARRQCRGPRDADRPLVTWNRPCPCCVKPRTAMAGRGCRCYVSRQPDAWRQPVVTVRSRWPGRATAACAWVPVVTAHGSDRPGPSSSPSPAASGSRWHASRRPMVMPCLPP